VSQKCSVRPSRPAGPSPSPLPIAQLDAALAELVTHTAPSQFLAKKGAATQSASTLLVTVGDNPSRLRTEASFAALCGASPVDVSSGKQIRHRLNRGGDRQANSALWQIVMTRMSSDPAPRPMWPGAPPRARPSRKSCTAARIWGIVRELAAAGLIVLADKGYHGAGDHIRTPYKGKNKPESQKAANRAHATLRSPGERANAQLKTWRILRKLRCCPWRAGQLAKAIHVLQTRELQTRVIGG